MSNDFRDDVDDLADDQLDAELDASELVLREQFGGGLAELLSPPEGLASRAAAGVGDALLTRSTLAAGLDLLAVGWHTLRFLAGSPDPDPTKESSDDR